MSREKINAMIAALPAPSCTAVVSVTQARRELVAGALMPSQFEQVCTGALGFAVPGDWTGRVTLRRGSDGSHWSVCAQRRDRRYQAVTDSLSQHEAAAIARTLVLIDALSEANRYERAAKLSRLWEEHVLGDRRSTDADRVAAREARKTAEVNAVLNDSALRERANAIAASSIGQHAAAIAGTSRSIRLYLDVPYNDKEAVKARGARWDKCEQAWYTPPRAHLAHFAHWSPCSVTTERVFLDVPYADREAAKAAGARWDTSEGRWFARPHADMMTLRCLCDRAAITASRPISRPEDEFAAVLASVGCLVDGEHPIMDGQPHRIRTEGDRTGERAGFYVGHLDGRPAGYVTNNRTGATLKWKAEGRRLSSDERAAISAKADASAAARAAEQTQRQAITAARVERELAQLVPVSHPTPYMTAKQIQRHAGVYTDVDGQHTYIPLTDIEGKRWTTQYIQPDGTKRFAKHGRLAGCFHAVDGVDAIARAPVLVIAEGYATAATLAEVLGYGAVAAFHAGALKAVAEALHARFPDKPVLIAGDDDRWLVLAQGKNVGRESAIASAEAVGGTAIFPVFAAGEGEYPSSLAPVTPDAYRAHLRATDALNEARDPAEIDVLRRSLLEPEQLAALSAMKRFSDFNDLVVNSQVGRSGLDRQVRAAVCDVVGRHVQSTSALVTLVDAREVIR